MPLLSDFWPHGAVSRAYGVFNQERGRSNRATFILDAEGIVRFIDVHKPGEVPDEEEYLELLATM